MLSKCSQLTKQIEELESQTKGLIKEIDKERDCHSHHTQKYVCVCFMVLTYIC